MKTAEQIQALIVETLSKRARARTSAEFDRLTSIYTALKNQWNKKTGNALLTVGA